MKDVLSVIVGGMVVTAVAAFAWFYPAQPRSPAQPVVCADIPESNERIIIVRDGQVECHYKITKVRGRK